MIRRSARLAAALALAVVTALVAPLAAQAAGYQFWGFYQLVDGEWGFATEGAGTTVPEDGSVEGFRFAVSAGDDVRVPRAVLEFDEICAGTPAEDGMKRVGLVIDPGRDVDAPEGVTPPEPGAQCVLAEPDATSQEILTQAVEDVRTDASGLICGIAGYPEEGCGDEVADPTPEQLAPDEPVEIPIAGPDDGDATPTEEPAATDDASGEDETSDAGETSGAGETVTAPPAETTTDDPAATTSDDGATADDQADAVSNETTDGARPAPWVWVVAVVALLAALGWAATASRNRRLRALEEDRRLGAGGKGDDYPDDYPDDPRDR